MARVTGGSGTSISNVTITGTVSSNIAQVGSTTITLGQKTMANSFPVVLASDQSNINTVIASALPAGTNVIGHVILDTGSTTAVTQATGTNLHMVVDSGTVTTVSNISQIASTTPTFNSSTTVAKNGLDVNVLSILGTAPTTAGKLDVKAADGDVFVRSNAASTFPTQATLQTQTDTVMVGGVNIKEINAVTPLMGNGVTGTGSQRVTIASDNTAFSVNPLSATAPVNTMNSASANSGVNSAIAAVFDDVAPTSITENSFGFIRMSTNRNLYGTIRDAAGNERGANVDANNNLGVVLAAETTKVLGVTRTADGSGNLLTTNSTTYTSKFALDGNLLGTLGTAFSTAGKVDVKAADGDVFVRQATAGNLNATVVGQATGSAVPSTAFYEGLLAQTALPSAATAGNLVGGLADKFGRQVVLPQAPRDLISSQTTTITNSTSETTIVTAGAAGVFNDLLSLVFINTSATATRVDLRDATAGSVIGAFFLPAGDTRGVSWNVPLPQTAAANNWTITCGTGVTDVRVLAQFVKNK